MTIRHLNIFVAVADYGSMSAAATHLYLSQPTVSQAIRELEKHYNGLLFERLGKKLYLTERGELLLPRARELVRQFEETEELILNQGQSLTLKLGSTITVGTCLTPRLIPELQKLEIRVDGSAFGGAVELSLAVKSDTYNRAEERITDITSGRVILTVTGERFDY